MSFGAIVDGVSRSKLLAAALAAAGACELAPEANQLLSQKWPIHFDSFYNLVELKSYAVTGNGHYDLNLPFFYVASRVGKVLGLNELSLFKLIVLASFLAFCAAVSLIAWKRERPVWSAAVLYLGLSSQTLFVSHYAYLKQASGMTAFAWGVAFVSLALVASGKRKWVLNALAAVAAVSAGAFHKFSGALVILYLLSARSGRFRRLFWILLLVVVVGSFSYLMYKAHPSLEANLKWNWPPRWYSHYVASRPYGLAQLLTELAFLFGVGTWLTLRGAFDQRFLYFVLYLILMLPMWGGATVRLGWYSSVWIFFLWLSSVVSLADAGDRRIDRLLMCLVTAAALESAFLRKDADIQGYNTAPAVFEKYADRLRKWIPEDAIVLVPEFDKGDHFEIRYFLDRKAALHPPPDSKVPIFHIDVNAAVGAGCMFLEELAADPEYSPDCVYLDKDWAIVREAK